MIQLFHVSKAYGRCQALRDVSVDIAKGDFVLLMGSSGAGKSTLLKLLFGGDQPDEGQILVQGQNIATLTGRQIPQLRRRMGIVFQDFRLLSKRTVFENVALPLMVGGSSGQDIRRRVSEALRAVGVEHKREHLPPTLSAGEQQRVSIARAIINSPIILLADEPTGNLDPELTADIVELFKQINARGTTVVVATHDPQVMRQVNRRVLTLRNGQILADQEGSFV
ncbi:MAG: cell division ATP-binding protein FtsE [Nitrospiraceae bacterium]